MNKVTLKIVGTQESVDGEINKIEMMTEGKYYEKNDSIFLVYDESEISGMEGSTTTLRIEADKVMMKRFGSNESKLVFEKGIRHKTVYKTIYGNMDMEVMTHQIKTKRDSDSLLSIYISYRLSISSQTQSKNTLSIDII